MICVYNQVKALSPEMAKSTKIRDVNFTNISGVNDKPVSSFLFNWGRND